MGIFGKAVNTMAFADNVSGSSSSSNVSIATTTTASSCNHTWIIESSEPSASSKHNLTFQLNNPVSNKHVETGVQLEIITNGSNIQLYRSNPVTNINAVKEIFGSSNDPSKIAIKSYTSVSESTYDPSLMKGTVKLYQQIVSGTSVDIDIFYITLKTVDTDYYAYISPFPPLA